ncbi:MAG TPA: GNAT family N-acetyltransferase [Candidatus Deferrimicrobium sp.]|nr:GNAT family N-acetyltransferase [Candidatus Deferrimicrobium sp.]
MSEINVRTAEIDDLATIRTLMIQLYEYYGIPFNEKRFEWGIKRRLTDRLQKEGILVAEDSAKQKVVGMIVAEILINPIGNSEGHITAIVTAKDCRDKGVGKALVDSAINHLEQMGAEIIRLDLEESFIKMLDYFKNIGFESVYRVLEYKPQ